VDFSVPFGLLLYLWKISYDFTSIRKANGRNDEGRRSQTSADATVVFCHAHGGRNDALSIVISIPVSCHIPAADTLLRDPATFVFLAKKKKRDFPEHNYDDSYTGTDWRGVGGSIPTDGTRVAYGLLHLSTTSAVSFLFDSLRSCVLLVLHSAVDHGS
jgi:hypothetical protein